MLSHFRRVGFALTVVVTAGCATTAPSPPSRPSAPPPASSQPRAAPPAPKVNLSGFPPDFRRGYADGCDSARSLSLRRDEPSFRGNAQYAAGWNDGNSVCRKRPQ
jgi:hypothetical protein